MTIVTGIIGGLSNAGMIAIIHSAMSRGVAPVSTLLVSYVGLCLLMRCSNVVSQLMLLRLSQEAIFDLRLRLCCQILKAVPPDELVYLARLLRVAAVADRNV